MAVEKPKPTEPEPVDLDLDVIAPPERTFRFKGRVYHLPGDVPVPTLIEAVKLRGKMEVDGDSSEDEQRQAVEAMFSLVMGLIRSENENVPELNVSVTQLMYLVGMILSGQENVTMDEALIETLSGGEGAAAKAEESADHPPTSRTPRKRKAA